MGQKGAKLTQEATKASERLVHTLSDLVKVYSRKMFGGYGIFESGAMFALITSEGKMLSQETISFHGVAIEDRYRLHGFDPASGTRSGETSAEIIYSLESVK